MKNKVSALKNVFLVIIFALSIALFLIYILKTPSNDRTWAKDQQVLPYAVFTDDTIEVFNVRNFTYTSANEYIPNYYDSTYKTDELISIDYIVEPFGSIGAAHTFISFGFENGDYLAVSAEIRKEVGESFSPLKGLFRSYELMYVVADERDVIKLRTNYRKDTVYVFPIMTSQENMQKLFTKMLTRANSLKESPEFYNTLTNNCTTNIADHINTISPNSIPWDIRLLLPENSDELAYELGLIDNNITLEEAREKYKVNDLAEKYGDREDFSSLIRTGR